jgi:hypothetical protein
MSEQWYDAEIAPKLAEIGKLCEARGVPFFAAVEYAPQARGETRYMPDDAGLCMKMLTMLCAAGENVDGFMIGLSRYCARKGIDMSSSMFLSWPKRESSK